MDISFGTSCLLSELNRSQLVPQEISTTLLRAPNPEYLNIISRLATTSPRLTSLIFTTHSSLIVDICGRWLSSYLVDKLSALASLAKILPLAPQLNLFAKALLERGGHLALDALASCKPTALGNLSSEVLQTLLLSLYRLLEFDNTTFGLFISPAQLQVLFGHTSRSVRYLAVRIFCLYTHATDVIFEELFQKCIGNQALESTWEDRTIDYLFLTLWERKRLRSVRNLLQEKESNRVGGGYLGFSQNVDRIIHQQDVVDTSAWFCGTLVPHLEGITYTDASFVVTHSTGENLKKVGAGINSGKPVLVTGPSASGKTSLVRHSARLMGKEPSMVTLHLNEQTDAKLLLGTYTSEGTPGSFTWQPGILTRAVLEGRWIFIENVNRTPAEVMSILLPLLERGELFIPQWGEYIQGGPGLRIFATMEWSGDSQGRVKDPSKILLSGRLWYHVKINPISESELFVIAHHLFPVLKAYFPQMLSIIRTIQPFKQQSSKMPAGSHPTNFANPAYLFKWCARTVDLFTQIGISSDTAAVSELTRESLFLEAVDSFTSFLPSSPVKDEIVATIAENLQIPHNRVDYCLRSRIPAVKDSTSSVEIGRIWLPKQKSDQRLPVRRHSTANEPFAITNHASRNLETISAALARAEPCLLVGETGTGKTTLVQRLASTLNCKLTVINLSQQSEASDLIGGYKPVGAKSIASSMNEDFSRLLKLTFPSKKNEHYIMALDKAMYRERWPRALTLWKEASRAVGDHLKTISGRQHFATEGPQTKKRKSNSTPYDEIKNLWGKFTSDLQTFEKLVSNEFNDFAFSFVESSMVKAVRNGDWVLLDEINLAPLETLESIADLICNGRDEKPSLLLSESGKIDRVRAHKNFRMFAAMNPATDIGKRELPLILRSRFTELFLEPADKSLDDLSPVVEVYLGNHCRTDARLSHDIAQLHLDIRRLADENLLADGANQRPHFSLRTLTRTLRYILDIAPIYGLRRSMYEGFCMSYLTVLNKESGRMLENLIERRAFGSHKHGKAILSQTPKVPEGLGEYAQFRHYLLRRGNLPIEGQEEYIMTPSVERNLLNLVRATSTGKFPVLLQGPTSSGKTSMIEHLAKISGHGFVRINNHEHTDLQEYLGTYVSHPDGRLYFQDGLLVRALKEGNWIVLDELNLAPTDVLEALNRLLDDNRELFVPEIQEVVRPHKNFMLFATQNPPGLYGGRKVLSRAFRNRFLELHFDDIPEEDLEIILRERSQIPPSFCTRIVAVYKRLSMLRQNSRIFEQGQSFATLRDLFRWAMRDADDREQLALNGFLLLGERVRNPDEKRVVKEVIEQVMKVKIQEDDFYSKKALAASLGSPLPAPHGVSWTSSLRRLYTLIIQAMKNNEPILLVGDTGTGKTTICQAVSSIMGMKLHIVNAHQNMETGDLIGSQRPVRDRESARKHLFRLLKQVLGENKEYDDEEDSQTLDSVWARYQAVERENSDYLPGDIREQISRAFAKANALFEWSDGALVQAMREGHHYLLDEISLADDSVLERLNSVLEPGRAILLAEKGSHDTFVSAASDFQFLATMNPSGDYGKRELSPALRNRFTEVWVPAIVEEEEIAEILEEKLSPECRHLSASMVKFAVWYASVHRGTACRVSIRDLLTWSHFINTFYSKDVSFSIYHGAAMVYIDRLGANPSGASEASFDHSDGQSSAQVCIENLSRIFGHHFGTFVKEAHFVVSSRENLQIGPFSIPVRAETTLDWAYSFQAPTTRTNLLKIARALQLKRPVLLEGSPGVGKTTLVSAIAKSIGVPLVRINLSEQTDLMDLFGSDVPLAEDVAGTFGWRDAPFLQALKSGHWVLLDEMNLASQPILEGLNACLDHRGQVFVPELDRVFQKHPDFVMFAAQNPHTEGSGRKGLPMSFVDRFTTVYAEAFSLQDLSIICQEICPSASKSSIDQIVQATDSLSSMIQTNPKFRGLGSPWELNLRDALRWLQLVVVEHGPAAFANASDFTEMILIQRFRTKEQKEAAQEFIRPICPGQEFSKLSNYTESSKSLQLGHAFLSKSELVRPSESGISQNSIKAGLTESVMLCIQHRWPCLLVGGSGSGKTSVVHRLSHAIGAEVFTVSLNEDLDASDLLGGFEQVDLVRKGKSLVRKIERYTTKRLIEHALTDLEDGSLSELHRELRSITQPTHDSFNTLSEWIKVVAMNHPKSSYPMFYDEVQSLASNLTRDTSGRFEWVEGPIITAIEAGKWLLLDNANLCNPSVLDRLNSLLEPNGFLSIDECPNDDGSCRIVHPHPNFRLFMTMNPSHGELSRAMRNRSVELFVPLEQSPQSLETSEFSSDPFTRQFESFQLLDWTMSSLADPSLHLSICFDHLLAFDLSKFGRFLSQSISGLLETSCFEGSLSRSLWESFEGGFMGCVDVFNRVRDLYGTVEQGNMRSTGWKLMQTIHPLNNAILLSHQNPLSQRLLDLGLLFDYMMRLLILEWKIDAVSRTYHSKPKSDLTRFERSVASAHNPNICEDSTKRVSAFLKEMIDGVKASILGQGSVKQIPFERNSAFFKDLLNYLKDVFCFTHNRNIREDELQLYVSIGESLAKHHLVGDPPTGHGKTLMQTFSTILKYIASSELKTGIAMEALWQSFRPWIPRNTIELDLQQKSEDLADKFDEIIWSCDATVQRRYQLQQSIIQFGRSLVTSSDPFSGGFREIQSAIDEEKGQSAPADCDVRPFFANEIEELLQCITLNNADLPDEMISSLALLAGRRTKTRLDLDQGLQSWGTLSRVSSLAGQSISTSEWGAVRQTTPLSLISKLSKLGDVAISGFEMVFAELETVGRVLSSNCYNIMKSPRILILEELRKLHAETSHALKHLDPSIDLATVITKLRRFLKECGSSSSQGEAVHLVENVASAPFYDDDILDTKRLGLYFIKLFAGLLLLYVPDQPFDPFLRSSVAKNRHQERVREAKDRLDSLVVFETAFSGRSSSYRISRAQECLEGLGPEPSCPSMLRPDDGIQTLLPEFRNILSVILMRLLDVLKDGALMKQESLTNIFEPLRANSEQEISRLSNCSRMLSDIVKPLIAMLHGLNAGISLALLVESSKTERGMKVISLSRITPFMDLLPEASAHLKNSDRFLESSMTIGLSQPSVESISLESTISGGFNETQISALFETYQSIYYEWKERLQESKRDFASKSSLFRYRGTEMDSEEIDKDVSQIFSPDEADYESQTSSFETATDPRSAAQKMARLHQKLFARKTKASEKMLDALDSAATTIILLWSNEPTTSCSPISIDRFLPALFVKLARAKDEMSDSEVDYKVCHFYRDANLGETRKLHILLRRVRVRFRELQLAWPEDASLGDTLKICDEILATGHRQSLANFLSKIERLHASVHEWQVVASREYTVMDLYDELTQLIIGWRRIELSTWPRLLDFEDKMCEEDTDAWWFLGYEVTIATPVALFEDKESLEPYAKQLFNTLADFIKEASLGQYERRLSMLRCFKKHIELLAKQQLGLKVVEKTLSNFIQYYDRFSARVRETVLKGRAEREKELKEIVLRASWKDTNISALRDSAKRSHYRLFKVIRKYRELLSGPVGEIIESGIGDPVEEAERHELHKEPTKSLEVDARALKICAKHLPGWTKKPNRRTNPNATTQQMARLGQIPEKTYDILTWITVFTSGLVSSIASLRNETPEKVTDENMHSVKQLQVRKKRLYRETLKTLRSMGFSSNPTSDVLEKQSSAGSILADVPASQNLGNGIDQTDKHFFRLLDLMPIIRSSTQRSDELTNSEIVQSIGYLENILALIIKQRKQLALILESLSSAKETCEYLRDHWSLVDCQVYQREQEHLGIAKYVPYVLKWLPPLLETGTVILGKQEQLSREDLSALKSKFGMWQNELASLSDSIKGLPELSDKLSSDLHDQELKRAVTRLGTLRQQLQQWTQDMPNQAFIFNQILPWTDIGTVEAEEKSRQTSNITLGQFDAFVSVSVDKILVAVQHLKEQLESLPTSVEDSSWLGKMDSALSRSLKSLASPDMSEVFIKDQWSLSRIKNASSENLKLAIGLCGATLPILEQYQTLQLMYVAHFGRFHAAICEMASVLASSFSKILRDGFCSPSTKAASDEGKPSEIESGTGLGEGEGMEDISSDVKDDEDLSDLAKRAPNPDDHEKIEGTDEAVNMDDEDMDGISDGEEASRGEKDYASSQNGEEDLDEEISSIGDADSEAVDEKLWNGSENGKSDEKGESKKSKGKKAGDDKDIGEDKKGNMNPVSDSDATSEDESSENGAEENEEVAREESGQMDPHVTEEQKLDLPEEINIDGPDGLQDSQTSDDDLDGMSDMGPDELADDENLESEMTDDKEIDSDSGHSQGEDEASDEEAVTHDKVSELGGEESDTESQENVIGDGTDTGRESGGGEKSAEKSTEREQINQQADQKDASGIQEIVERQPETNDEQTADEAERAGGIEGRPDEPGGKDQMQAEMDGGFKKLGDALEKWHRQQQEIQRAPQQERAEERSAAGQDVTEQQFEHLFDEDDAADTQALGKASHEQATPLDHAALDSETKQPPNSFENDYIEEEKKLEEDHTMDNVENKVESYLNEKEQENPGPFMSKTNLRRSKFDASANQGLSDQELNSLNEDFSITNIQIGQESIALTEAKAQRLWLHNENITRDLSLHLTERLRLILAPTLASKMRGDFRTGKRLNIKRIIPYIASNYKRDKIWMRRSIPSKRNYQIMLAVDDSRSMKESGGGQLAFQALTLVAKSLHMLEAGEISVLGFGSDVFVAHAFETPFSSSEAGGRIYERFAFDQTGTNVRRLVSDSISLFRDARRRQSQRSSSGADVWQLELIISDGVCEEHEEIRRLLQQAYEERIMIVFVIVDALVKGGSILDMNRAVFEPDPATGEMGLKMRRYLDGFPFGYYVVVRDVGSLPAVLAEALRQWFSEVVDSR